jgi:hypothetical protein
MGSWEFQASLGYTEILPQKKKKTKQKENQTTNKLRQKEQTFRNFISLVAILSTDFSGFS